MPFRCCGCKLQALVLAFSYHCLAAAHHICIAMAFLLPAFQNCAGRPVSCEPVLTHHHKPALPAYQTSERCPKSGS